MTSLPSIPLIVVAVASVVAGVIDAIRLRIPNWLTVTLLVSGLAYHGVTGGLAGLEHSVAGLMVNFLLVVVLYLIGAMGAGDVKLIAAIGAWLGIPGGVYVFAVAELMTGIYSVAAMLWQGGVRRVVVSIESLFYQLYNLAMLGRHLAGIERVETVARRGDRRQLVPFAAMVALGVIAVILWRILFP